MAARYDEEEQLWYPPRRVFSFNPEVKRTDGLLAESVARTRRISMRAASAIVKSETEKMAHQLQTERKLDLGLVGSLSVNEQGLITYILGKTELLSPELLWLPIVKAVDTEALGRSNRSSGQPAIRRLQMTLGRAAAVIAILFATAWIVKTALPEDVTTQAASLLPLFNSEEGSDDSQPTDTSLLQATQTSEAQPCNLILNVYSHEDAVIDVNKDEERRVNSLSTGEYVLVVASLSSEQEAREFIAAYPTFSLGLLQMDNRYRVYAAVGDTFAEAAAKNTEVIAQAFPQSWVCKR